MKNLKRLLALASAMALAVSLTACGPQGGSGAPANSTSAQTPPSSSTPVEPDEAKPYIEIPAEFQSWDENGQQITRSMLTTADNGMVSSLNYVASKVGADILESGGNAIDAFGVPLPESAVIHGTYSGELARCMEEEVGIPAEKQIWLEEEAWQKRKESES